MRPVAIGMIGRS